MPDCLYHFTAEHLARKIKQEGITKGGISKFDANRRFIGIERGWIWLTTDPDWHQEWCAERILIPYDRAAVRFTVEIPDSSRHMLYTARELLTTEFPNTAWLLDLPGSHAWRLYRGKIFRRWLTAVEVKPLVEIYA